MGDAYGGTNLQEFAAEYVGNGEFQALLKQIQTPRGDSFWAGILNSILEFLNIRKGNTAYDTAFKFLDELLDVSQGIEPTPMETLYLGNGDVDVVMTGAIEERNGRTENALNALSVYKDDKAIVFALGSASLPNMQNMFGETSPKYRNNNPLPISSLLDPLERKRGEVNQSIDETSKNIREMTKAERDATPAQVKEFNDLAIEARLLSLDFLKPLRANSNDRRKAEYKKLNNRFNQLPEPLQKSYRTLRAQLDAFLDQYVTLITEVLPDKDRKSLQALPVFVG